MTIVTTKGKRIKVSAMILINADSTKLCFNNVNNQYTELDITQVSHIEPDEPCEI